jgi:hypothetical protein
MLQNTNEVAMLIAEDAPDIKSHIHALHKLYTDRSFMDLPPEAFQSKRIVDSVYFAKKDQSLLLQIADHCAFLMKRKLMRKADAQKLFAKIEPQIAWKPVASEYLATRIKLSELAPVTTSGSLLLGDSSDLLAAFDSVVEGAQSGLGKDNLLPHLRKLRAAQDQAFGTEAGRQYMRARPTLKRRAARLSDRTSNQK